MRVRLLPILLAALLAPFATSLRGAADAPTTQPTTQPATRSADAGVVPISAALRSGLHLDDFYQQTIDDDGFPILASAKTRPEALLEARYLIDHMLAHREEIRRALIDVDARLVVMATSELTTDVPEQRKLTPKSYWDRRARGLGGRVTSCAEENLLRCPGNPYAEENILIHEFAHCIQDVGMKKVDPTFDKRMRVAYDEAVKSGAWGKAYAITNRHEYFAEGAQAWFDAGRKRKGSDANNGIGTRELLKQADPKLAALCAEVFGDDEWRYVPPERRKDLGHLAGLDRSTLPRFVWPKELIGPATQPKE